jgi:hypothetical protein
MALQASSGLCCISLHSHLGYANQHKALLASDDYHCQYSFDHNVYITGGKYREVRWRRMCKCREIMEVLQ